MVQLFGSAFRVQSMDAYQWCWCLFLGFSELIWGQLVLTVPKQVVPTCLRCVTTENFEGTSTGHFSWIRGTGRTDQQVWPTLLKAFLFIKMSYLFLKYNFIIKLTFNIFCLLCGNQVKICLDFEYCLSFLQYHNSFRNVLKVVQDASFVDFLLQTVFHVFKYVFFL